MPFPRRAALRPRLPRARLGSRFIRPAPGPLNAAVTAGTVAAVASVGAVTAGQTRTFTSATTTVQATGLTAGLQYQARVRARDAAGNVSAWSAPISFTTVAPAAPGTVAATTTVGTATPTIGVQAAPGSVAATTAIPAPTVVTASGGTATPSTVAAATTVPAPPLSTGWTGTAATVTGAAAITAPAVTAGGGATATPGVVTGTTTITTPAAGLVRTFTFVVTSGQVTGLTPAATYTARVRARDAAGNWSDYSTPITFTTAAQGTASPSTVTGGTTITRPVIGAGLTAPTVTAGPARPVTVGGSVLLDVTATPPGAQSIAGYSWAIQSGGGTVTNPNSATPTYTAPSSGSGLAVIRATVSASGGGNATADVTVSYHATIIAAENALTGTARATWDLADPNLGGITTLQGFADGYTYNRDQTVSFKIAQSDTAGWSADVYRLGYYGGNGARLYGTATPTGGQLTASQAQPAPTDADASTTKLSADCSGWSVTLTWTPPVWAPTGFYLLRLNRTGGGASHVHFILRDDARRTALMLMPSDSTWMAYNAFGGMGANYATGNSYYFGTPGDQYNADAARFVSYNRPVINRHAMNTGVTYGGVDWSNFFAADITSIRFLERNGYDVKYYGCIDACGDATGLHLIGNGTTHGGVGAAMYVGHNEYWSNAMRAGWEAAKAAGVNIFAAAGNDVFWRTIGTNPDSQGRPRTYECQKSTIGGRGNTRPEWTGTWRDSAGAGKGGNNPENQFTGQIFAVNGYDFRAFTVPFNGGYSQQPLWRNTPNVAALTAGQTWTSPGAEILGFEWDTYGPAGTNTAAATYMAAPNPRILYCSTTSATFTGGLALTDAGQAYGAGTVTHRLTVIPGGNGGIVFGAGTCNWGLGLDNGNTIGGNNVSVDMQQATVNILADMGAQPATLISGLVAATPVDWFVDTVQGIASIGSPTVTAVSVPAPATVAGTVTVGAAVTAGSTLTPATVTGSATIGAAVTAGATPVPGTVAAVAIMGTPGVSTANVPVPATVAAVAAVAAPVVQGAATVTPAAVAAATTISAAVAVGAVAVPPTVAATTAVSATVTTTGLATPGTVAAVTSVGAAQVVAGNVPVPATVQAVAAVGAPALAAGARPLPATVTAGTTISAAGTAGATAAPGTVAAVTAVGTPAVQVRPTPGTVQAVAAVGAPAVGGSTIAAPGIVAGTATVGAAIVRGSVAVPAATVAALAAVGATAILTSSKIAAVAVAGTASVGGTVTLPAQTLPGTVAGTATIGTPLVRITINPATVAAAALIGATRFDPGLVTPGNPGVGGPDDRPTVYGQEIMAGVR